MLIMNFLLSFQLILPSFMLLLSSPMELKFYAKVNYDEQ